jgi:hypothetical protein
MATIPSSINGVAVDFASAVKNNVVQSVIDALRHCIKPDIAPAHPLARIFISSARRQGSTTSRHNTGKAVDISRINGIKMVTGFPSDPQVKAIVTAIQNKFESFPKKRENFGPAVKKKEGVNFPISGHKDHIHFSVD